MVSRVPLAEAVARSQERRSVSQPIRQAHGACHGGVASLRDRGRHDGVRQAEGWCKEAATSPPTLAGLMREQPRRCLILLQRTTAMHEANHHHDHGDDQEKMNVTV